MTLWIIAMWRNFALCFFYRESIDLPMSPIIHSDKHTITITQLIILNDIVVKCPIANIVLS